MTKLIQIFVLLHLLIACKHESKSGIQGSNNDNNKVIMNNGGTVQESVTHIHNYKGNEKINIQKGVQMLNTFDPEQLHIGNLIFPLTIIDFIKNLGEPTEIMLTMPDDISGPGNSCWWRFYDHNIELIVTTNDYSMEKLDFNTESEFFSVQLLDKRTNSAISMPLGTYLGIPISELEKKINKFLHGNNYWKLIMYDVEDDYGNMIKNGSFLITNDQFYMVFLTNGKKLIRIEQSIYNPYNAG